MSLVFNMLTMEFWLITSGGGEEIRAYIFLASRTNIKPGNKHLRVISLYKRKETIMINDIASEKKDGEKEMLTMVSRGHEYLRRET